ncbi:hypothetical protein [Nocardia sp. NPDC046763]
MAWAVAPTVVTVAPIANAATVRRIRLRANNDDMGRASIKVMCDPIVNGY